MKNEIIYEIFIPTFYDGLGTGKGNIRGIIKKLPYLNELGITRIWLSPFYKSPFKDSGYDVSDYYDVNPNFGTLKDIEELIKTAEKFNISIMIDIVFNHTSYKHEWFKKALDGNKKYMDFYIFKDPVNNTIPTNWKSKMGGSVWEYVPSLKKYYLHLFTKEQPDLNWNNTELQKELINILEFWKSKGVKGFRLDVCNLYDKPIIFTDDNIGDGRRFYTDGPKITDYFKIMYEKVFKTIDNCFTVGEVSSTTKEKSVNYAQKDNKQLNTIFTFLHLKIDYINNDKWTYSKPDLNLFWKLTREWQEYYQKNNAMLALFLNNHDQPRSISRFGNTKKHYKNSAIAIFGFVLFMRGYPFLYQGEEIGMTNLNLKNIEDFKDVESIGHISELLNKYSKEEVLKILNTKSRDNARSIMQWNDSKFSGFTSSDKCDLYLNDNYKKINVENQKNNENSILNEYKKLINLRKQNEIFNSGKIIFFDKQDYAYKRILNDEEIIILTNWTDDIKINKLKISIDFKIIYNNQNEYEKDKILPYQLLILKRIKNEI